MGKETGKKETVQAKEIGQDLPDLIHSGLAGAGIVVTSTQEADDSVQNSESLLVNTKDCPKTTRVRTSSGQSNRK